MIVREIPPAGIDVHAVTVEQSGRLNEIVRNAAMDRDVDAYGIGAIPEGDGVVCQERPCIGNMGLAIHREDDDDFVAPFPKCRWKRSDDVGEAAGLDEWSGFRRHHHDSGHRFPIVAALKRGIQWRQTAAGE